LSNNLG